MLAFFAAAVLASASLTLAGVFYARLVRLRRAAAALDYANTHDQLTGLCNRAGLERAWPVADAHPARSVLLLDLDGFKPVNDQHGHAAGDQVLTEVARRIGAVVPGAARLGGDEFAAVLIHPDPLRLAQRLAASIAAPVTLASGAEVTVTASLGVAAGAGEDLSTALACADAAMYRAKSTGTRCAVYHPQLDDRTSPAGDPRPAARVRELPATAPAWEVAA